MAAKKIIYGMEARNKLFSGIEQVANTVKVTLGPKGCWNVLGREGDVTPLITNDGVTIANEISLPDPFEDMGARLVKEIAEKTNKDSGDGTTTATILAYAIIREGLKLITAGINPIEIKRGLNIGLEHAINYIQNRSRKIDDDLSAITYVANISSRSKEIGELITCAIEQVGKDGSITIQEGQGIETILSITEGMEYDRGYLSPYMVTDKEQMICDYDDPYILVTDYDISSIAHIKNLLEQVSKTGKKLFIVCNDLTGDALQAIVINNLQGTFKCCAIQGPAYSGRRKEIMDDIATFTGAIKVSRDTGLLLENANLTVLGSAKKVVVGKSFTTIIEGAGNPEDIDKRITMLKLQIEQAENDFDKEKIRERISKMLKGVAVIELGGNSETEIRDTKLRLDDALCATRAAIKSGIIPGGATIYLRIIKDIQSKLDTKYKDLSDNEKLGLKLFCNMIQEPFRQLCINAEYNPDILMKELNEIDLENAVVNIEDMKIGDAYELGIIDPAKVAIDALKNAVSISGLILTTEVLVSDK